MYKNILLIILIILILLILLCVLEFDPLLTTIIFSFSFMIFIENIFYKNKKKNKIKIKSNIINGGKITPSLSLLNIEGEKDEEENNFTWKQLSLLVTLFYDVFTFDKYCTKYQNIFDGLLIKNMSWVSQEYIKNSKQDINEILKIFNMELKNKYNKYIISYINSSNIVNKKDKDKVFNYVITNFNKKFDINFLDEFKKIIESCFSSILSLDINSKIKNKIIKLQNNLNWVPHSINLYTWCVDYKINSTTLGYPDLDNMDENNITLNYWNNIRKFSTKNRRLPNMDYLFRLKVGCHEVYHILQRLHISKLDQDDSKDILKSLQNFSQIEIMPSILDGITWLHINKNLEKKYLYQNLLFNYHIVYSIEKNLKSHEFNALHSWIKGCGITKDIKIVNNILLKNSNGRPHEGNTYVKFLLSLISMGNLLEKDHNTYYKTMIHAFLEDHLICGTSDRTTIYKTMEKLSMESFWNNTSTPSILVKFLK